MTSDEKIMKKCLGLAARAAANGDVPIGCIITDADGKIVARAFNSREKDADPTAHAEVLALRKAGRRLKLKNLSGCTLYVTLEPCVMCAGAIVNARIGRVRRSVVGVLCLASGGKTRKAQRGLATSGGKKSNYRRNYGV